MEITALFCDNATAAADGKLDIRGVFNELYAPDFPARQDHLVLAGVMQWERQDAGRKPFRIDLTHPDGHSVFTIEGHTDVEARPEPRPPAKTYLVLPMENVIFTSPGRYGVRTHVNGREYAGPSLFLVKSAAEENS